jgi:hypothetical protein
MALLPGSPALNAGDITNAPAYDQRGPRFPRVLNGTTDIGAFELQTSHLAVTGFPSVLTAGSGGTFTVTALNANGSTDTSYTGTVHFTSSDPKAVLPINYTFTAADKGVHTFTATLKTAGTQSVTVKDTSAGLSGCDTGITVKPAAASTLSVTGLPTTTTAGVACHFTVTLRDPYGNIATGYTGTVHFTSSDQKAALPANYTFTSADTGQHTFTATFETAGTQSVTATDTVTSSITGTSKGIAVNPAAASQFILSAPSSVNSGSKFSVTVTVEDAYGNVVTGYTGTVRFSRSDSTATLPANFTFTAADDGVYTFANAFILKKKGTQTITVTDTKNSALTATDSISVG